MNSDNSTPTGLTYKFSTFQELVDKVPSGRIRDCMEELGCIFASAKALTQLTYGVAKNVAEGDGVELPPEPERVIVIPDTLEWIDDGKRNLEARMVDNNGNKIVSVHITPGKQS